MSVTDGMWIIFLGVNGITGLMAFYGTILLGPIMILARLGKRAVGSDAAAVVVLAMVCAIYALDCIPNAMPNPVFLLVAAGLTTVAGRAHVA